MITCIKTPVSKDQVEPLCTNFLDNKFKDLSKILASIFVRRNITEGKDILYYLEDDLRFQNEPFLLPNMEDAVERILQAKEEGEKVLIFGDSDVDGVTSTAILYKYLKYIGIDVQWQLPMDDDAYGLSIAAVDDFEKEGGSLIITVDCGISNNAEVDYAASKGIDVIVTDHHNPPSERRLPRQDDRRPLCLHGLRDHHQSQRLRHQGRQAAVPLGQRHPRIRHLPHPGNPRQGAGNKAR